MAKIKFEKGDIISYNNEHGLVIGKKEVIMFNDQDREGIEPVKSDIPKEAVLGPKIDKISPEIRTAIKTALLLI